MTAYDPRVLATRPELLPLFEPAAEPVPAPWWNDPDDEEA